MALKDKRLPPDLKPDPELAAALAGLRIKDGTVPCASAIGLAADRCLSPSVVGRELDAAGVRIGLCQIGVFGYPGHAKGWDAAGAASEPVPDGLREALLEAGGTDRRISCSRLWTVAASFGVTRMLAGYLADRAGLKIVKCQLGSF